MPLSFRRFLQLLVSVLPLSAAMAPSIWAAGFDDAPSPGVKTRPIDVKWEYSTDGGKTFGEKPPEGAPPNMKVGIAPRAFRGTFEIADPKAVAGLWIRILAKQTSESKPAICTGDLIAASGGYWKDLGHCPTLLNARALLNGKQVPVMNGPMLYFWLPLEGPLAQGKNTIELSGDCYTYWGSPAAEALTASLIAAEPQPASIYGGPVLGDFGDGYFTVSFRTQLPADVVIEATPTTPPGKGITVASSHKIWHRLKVQLPPGTKAASYTLKSTVGTHETTRGPFTMVFPEKEFRFVAVGNLLSHRIQAERLKMIADRVIAMKAALVVDAGNMSEHASWDHDWERRYFEPAGKMTATIPTLFTPAHRDFAGIIQEIHYTPAQDTFSHNWSKVVGPVRFIGLDGTQTWKPDGENTKWLEQELKGAREKFLFVLNAFPAFSSGGHSKKPYPALVQSREVIMPLLAKYHASALISGNDTDYERCEPTPDAGCTQIVIGCSGKEVSRFSGPAIGRNPFARDKGREWAGAEQTRAILVFDVKDSAVEMRCLEMPDDPARMDEKDLRLLDTKIFQPRKN